MKNHREINHREIDLRLATIEGHIKGIRQMISDDKSCDEVLQQMSAAIGAMQKLSKKILVEHANGCIRNASHDEDYDKVFDNFIDTLNKFF